MEGSDPKEYKEEVLKGMIDVYISKPDYRNSMGLEGTVCTSCGTICGPITGKIKYIDKILT